MTYPSQSTIRSYGGACPPSYLVATLASSYTSGQTFTLASTAGWYEISSTGQATTNPLGTSGPFVLVLDFSTTTEEKVLCSAVNVSTGLVTVWTDGSNNGRGYDGTTISAHATSSTPNCFPVASAVENLQLNSGVVSALADSSTALSTANSAQSTANTALANAATAQGTANTAEADAQTGIANAASAQATANAKVASVTAADGTITIAGTATAPTVKVGTVPYGQVSGTPSSLPPSGSAGGDLTGSYPNPTLAVNRLALTGGTLTGALNGTTATFTGEVTGSDIVASGLTGATTATRYVGGTVNGAPASGTFAKGDFVIDQSGTIWVCTTAGTPGTWTTTISSHLSLRTASATVGRNETTIFSGSTASQTLTAPSNPIDGSTWTVINKASVSVSLSFTPSMVPLGSGSGVTTYTVSAGGAYSFVNYNGSQWYMVGTNGADHLVDYSSVALSAWGVPTSAVSMNSQRLTTLPLPGATTDPARAGDISNAIPSTVHGLKAWTYDPAAAAGATVLLAGNTLYFSAIYVPYAMTVSQIWAYVNTAGTNGSSGTSLYLGIYSAGTLLGSTANQNTTLGFTTALGYSLTSPVSLTAGTYWIGMKFTAGTGGVAPTVQRSGQTTNSLTNFNVSTSNQSVINQRAATASGLSGALPSDLTALSNITFASTLLLHGLS